MVDEFGKARIKKEIEDQTKRFMDQSIKDLKGKIGLIDPFMILEQLSIEETKSILQEVNRDYSSNNKDELILKLLDEILGIFISSDELKQNYGNPVNYLGEFLYAIPSLEGYFKKHDFISKVEMLEVAADWLADLKINVYNLTETKENRWDLLLTKRVHTTKSELVVLMRGLELPEKYPGVIANLEEATHSVDWVIFITTPLGILKLEMDTILHDMEELGVWVYCIDPFNSVIYGLLKGGQSSHPSEELEQELLSGLSQPFRAPDPKRKFSQFLFDEKFQYKPKSYVMFGKNEYQPQQKIKSKLLEKDEENVQYLLIYQPTTGIRFDYFSWSERPLEADLISGLISAIDTFGKSVASSEGINEIIYKGLTISCADGQYAKACLILKENPSPRLKELLSFILSEYEKLFTEEMKSFKGDLGSFNRGHQKALTMINEILFGEI